MSYKQGFMQHLINAIGRLHKILIQKISVFHLFGLLNSHTTQTFLSFHYPSECKQLKLGPVIQSLHKWTSHDHTFEMIEAQEKRHEYTYLYITFNNEYNNNRPVAKALRGVRQLPQGRGLSLRELDTKL